MSLMVSVPRFVYPASRSSPGRERIFPTPQTLTTGWPININTSTISQVDVALKPYLSTSCVAAPWSAMMVADVGFLGLGGVGFRV